MSAINVIQNIYNRVVEILENNTTINEVFPKVYTEVYDRNFFHNGVWVNRGDPFMEFEAVSMGGRQNSISQAVLRLEIILILVDMGSNTDINELIIEWGELLHNIFSQDVELWNLTTLVNLVVGEGDWIRADDDSEVYSNFIELRYEFEFYSQGFKDG
jgi:hypothetical protein